jgi:hypothetical protein
LALSLNSYLHLREARAIEQDGWSHRLGTLAHVLIAANSDPEKRSEVPSWHEIFEPISLRYRSELANQDSTGNAPEVSPEIVGTLMDGFVLRHREESKRKRRAKHKAKPQ